MNKKYFFTTLSLFVVVIVCAVPFFVPAVAHAQVFNANEVCRGQAPDCNFDDLLDLAKRIINFLILLSIPLATIAFAWAGILFLTAGGSSSQAEKAKEIFTKVLWGFFFVLTAWLIVWSITSAILNKDNYYNPLSVAALSRDC